MPCGGNTPLGELPGNRQWTLRVKMKPHRRHFVPVEDEGHAAAAVVQVAAVGLALGGGGLSRRRSGHGAHPPVVAGR